MKLVPIYQIAMEPNVNSDGGVTDDFIVKKVIIGSLTFWNWANPGLFWFIFVLFTSQFQFKLKKRSCCAWDSNPGSQDDRRRRIHWAMVAAQRPLTDYFVQFVEQQAQQGRDPPANAPVDVWKKSRRNHQGSSPAPQSSPVSRTAPEASTTLRVERRVLQGDPPDLGTACCSGTLDVRLSILQSF